MRSTILFVDVLLISILLSNQATAQVTPQFQATIYVEDAAGNRDSVIVGFDTLATTGIDPQFGEVEITAPFDSVLDMRVASLDWPDRTLKVDIEPAGPIYPLQTSMGCYSAFRSFIYIWAKHQPVTVSWDSTAFLENICVRGSLLSNHWADEVATPYYWDFLPQNEYYCQADRSSFTIDLSAEAVTQANVIQPVVIEKEIEGMGIQEIYGLRFFPSPTFTAWTPCFYITDVTEINATMSATVFPNPTTGNFRVRMPEGVKIKQIELFDFQGRSVFSAISNQRDYDISRWSSGLYFLLIKGDDENLYSSKIAKQ